MEQEKINRINELARKAKTQTLTPEELEEVEMAFNSIGIYYTRRDA